MTATQRRLLADLRELHERIEGLCNAHDFRDLGHRIDDYAERPSPRDVVAYRELVKCGIKILRDAQRVVSEFNAERLDARGGYCTVRHPCRVDVEVSCSTCRTGVAGASLRTARPEIPDPLQSLVASCCVDGGAGCAPASVQR